MPFRATTLCSGAGNMLRDSVPANLKNLVENPLDFTMGAAIR